MPNKSMVMESFFFFFPLFLFLIIVFAYLVFHTINKARAVYTPLLPPGSTGWPLIGESFGYISKMRNGTLERFVLDRTRKYSSNVFKTSILGQRVAVLSGREGNKFMFSNQDKFKVWFPRVIEKIFPNPESFVKALKTLPSILNGDALKKYIGVMDTVMKNQLHGNNDQVIKVETFVRKYTLTVACGLFLSLDDPEEIEMLGKSMQDIDDGIAAVPINLPGTALNRAVKGGKVVRRTIEALVKQRRIDLSSGKTVTDILSDMILATDENGRFFSETEITSHVSNLLQGGYSTLNGTLTCIMKYLAELPDVYKNVYREQMEIKSSKEISESLTWEDMRKMKYSWNVANEVLRLVPIGPGGFREATTDIKYGEYTIPRGWKLHWMKCPTSKSPEYFENPTKFDPSRFEGKGPARYRYTFVPFGGGARMCPGSEYARLAILVFMHNMVTNFKWEKLIPDEKLTYNPAPKLSHGLPIRLFPH